MYFGDDIQDLLVNCESLEFSWFDLVGGGEVSRLQTFKVTTLLEIKHFIHVHIVHVAEMLLQTSLKCMTREYGYMYYKLWGALITPTVSYASPNFLDRTLVLNNDGYKASYLHGCLLSRSLAMTFQVISSIVIQVITVDDN